MVLIVKPLLSNHGLVLTSFRPLAGIMVLIILVKLGWLDIQLDMFPSPYGDYGSYPHPL